ncbi:MAG: methyltransferase domain-containing protein [Candidatus Omnitrophota bacterium]
MKRSTNIISSYLKTIEWVKKNSLPEKGIIVSSWHNAPYLEVTGYLIPTLIEAGEHKLAEKYADFLSYMQRPNGAFAGPDGKIYAFDTAQALRGLLSASQIWSKYKQFAQKAADYIKACITKTGQIPSGYKNQITENVHIYILPALMHAAKILQRPDYFSKANKSAIYYMNKPDIFDTNHLTHFLAYIIDGFIEIGEVSFIRPFARKILLSQKKNGMIPALPNASWTCSVGNAQLAIIGYKLGFYNEADKILNYLCKIQNSSGGFYGSYGPGASYFPDKEISWANKFFIDAIYYKVSSFFDRNINIFPLLISNNDGRVKAVLAHSGDLRNKKILDAGCGKGRFAVLIKKYFPSCEVHAVDISGKLLDYLPKTILKEKASIKNLPYKSETFDVVYCVEVLEHTLDPEKAINEICRVLKTGGKLIIIDKNIEFLGKLKIVDFEQWFNKNRIKWILKKHCTNVHVEKISYDCNKADGLFLAWTAVKNTTGLDSSKWHTAIIGKRSAATLADAIKNNKFPVWTKPLLLHTCPGDTILELGSGTGELSVVMAIYNRKMHLLDYSQKNLEFSKNIFKLLHVKGNFHHADALKKLPFKNNSFDWILSSGLLEHFPDEQVISILKESKRISRRGTMCLVPNANAIFYQFGKFKMIEERTWPYGFEVPKFSMKPYFKKAGYRNIKEYSVGSYHALNFVRGDKKAIKKFYNSLSMYELRELNQGYLLFTCGEK